MWRWEKVGKEGGVETQRARTEEERERKERRLRAGSLEGTQGIVRRPQTQAAQPPGNHQQRTTRRSDVRSAPPLSSIYHRKSVAWEKQASITYTWEPAHALPGGDTDQFRHRCIHSSKHAHIGERNNHFCNIQYVQYVVHQPPTGGAFESVSFLSAWIDRYSTGGLRRGYLSEILIQITRSNTAMLLTESTMSSLHITIVMRSHLGISY